MTVGQSSFSAAASGRRNLVAWSGVLRPAAGGSGGRHGEISPSVRGPRVIFTKSAVPLGTRRLGFSLQSSAGRLTRLECPRPLSLFLEATQRKTV